jgi:Helix-turn-helix domain of resolvase
MTRRSTRAVARATYREHTPAAARPAKAKRNRPLIARVRALYEDTVVPVHEIARTVGVTERTIYKYAARHGWKQRYSWALVRGDARRTVVECREAEQRARAAQREAEADELWDESIRALESVNCATDKLMDYLKSSDKKRPLWQTAPDDDPVERGLRLVVDFALDRHEALLTQWHAIQNGEPSL